MSKIKKLLIFIIFAIAICLIPKNVNAIIDNLGATVSLNYGTLKDSSTLYCIDHGSPLNSWQDEYVLEKKNIVCNGVNVPTTYTKADGTKDTYTCKNHTNHEYSAKANGGKHIVKTVKTYVKTSKKVWYPYKVIDYIKINKEGDILHGDVARSESTGIETTAGVNAKLAYVLAHGSGYSGSYFGEYSEAQMAVYYYFDEFKNPFLSIQVSADNKAFAAEHIGDLINQAEQYAANLAQWKSSGGVLEDKTTKNQTGEVTTTLEYLNDIDGARKAFLKVGPITWQYPGEIGEFHVNDDSIPGVRAGTYEGESFVVGECNSSIIKSDTPFYVLIPADSGVSNISIHAKIEGNIQVYSADIAILQYAGKQYLIEGEGSTIPVDGNINVDYKLASGSLKVQKRDVYNKTYPVAGVTFIFQHKATGLYVAKNAQGQIIYVSDEQRAAQYTTQQNGETTLTGVVEGTYIAKEIKITNQNYTINKGRTTTINLSREQIAQGNLIIQKIYNKRNPVKVKIKGKVWTPTKTGKDETAINDADANEYKEKYLLVNGIKATLFRNAILVDKYDSDGNLTGVELQPIKDSNGNVIDEQAPTYYEIRDMNNELIDKGTLTTSMYTNANGEYTLEAMITYPDPELTAYSVKFNYDGIDFKGSNTPKYDLIINGSKAMESTSQRKALDNKYATISGRGDNSLTNGMATNANEIDTTTLNYKVSNGKDAGTNAQSKIEGLSAGYSISGKKVTANTNLVNSITATYYFKKGSQRADNPGAVEKYFDSANNVVNGINLMLTTRESPDLAVTNQIENVVTTINGYNNLYKTTLTRNNLDPNNSDMKVGVTYVTSEEKLSKFTVYPSDVKTWANDSGISDKLQVYITYKVSITNQSTTLYNKVKELAIYYDSNYELQYIGDSLDGSKNNYAATKNYTQYSNSKYIAKNVTNTSNYPSEYKRVYIPVNGVISNNKSKDLYMTFKVSDEEMKKMLADSNYVPTMKNVIEISAYSTYYDEAATRYYAGVDKDSAPGNVNMSNLATNKVDDDTGIAREFTISQKAERTLTGAVFLDNTDNTLKTGEERKGNSIFDQGENTFKNLDIKLVGNPNSKSINKVTGKSTTTVNNTNKVTYEIDNGEHITDGNTYYISGFIPGEYKISYTYNNQTYYMDGQNKVYINPVDYKSAIVYDVNGKTKVKSALEGKNTDWYKLDNPRKDGDGPFTRYNEAVDEYNTRQTIDNKYKTVDINNSGNTTQNDTSSMTASTPLMQITVELNTTSSGNTYTPQDYHMINMDFGITERPRQEMKIEKEVSSIKLTLANGQVLMDAIIKDGKVQDKVSGMKVLPRTTGNKGTVSLELDSELIHGATLEIGYTMKATNISELDYTDENYYKYGIIDPSKIVRITPSKVLDYTDNSLTFVKEQNNDDRWNIVKATKVEGNNERLNVSKTQIVDNKLYEDVKGNEIKKSNINTIVESDYWANKNSALAPKEANSQLNLKLTKLLSNTDEEMTYNNDVEIIQVTKTGGRSVQTQIGKYSFGEEGIGGSSEEVTITPPTGENQDITIYYTAGIALAIFLVVSAGVVTFVIRRKNK